MPSRRAYLAAATALFAGCAAGPGTPTTAGSPDGPVDPPSSTRSPSPTRADDVECLPADDPALAWAVRLPEPVANRPAVDPDRDRIYVGAGENRVGTPTGNDGDAQSGALFCLGATDGEAEWRADADAPVVERPLVHDGRVHAVVGRSTGLTGVDQRIVAFGRDGERRWTSDPTRGFLSVVGADGGTVFAGTSDDAVGVSGERLFAFDRRGDVAWEREAGDATGGTVADGRLLYGAGMQALVAYDPDDGTEVWRAPGEPLGNPATAIATVGGLCFTESRETTDEGYPLVARSASDGSEVWRYASPTGSGENFVPTGVADIPESIDGLNYEHGFVGVEYGGLVFNLVDDGRERWTFTADGKTPDGPVVGDAIYVGDSEGTVYALEPSDGSERWRAALPAAASVRPLADGVLAFSFGESEHVLASIRGDGTERWRYTTTTDLTLPVVAGNRGYAVATDGTVLAFAAGGSD